MSKVITFSKTYPSYHPMKLQPTFFKDKILCGLYLMQSIHRDFLKSKNLIDANDDLLFVPKFTTIRAGYRFIPGEAFSPREWSDKPYRSKQEKIFDDIVIRKTWKFDFRIGEGFFLEGHRIRLRKTFIPGNDGLTYHAFMEWFAVTNHFDGQIICWNDKVNYDEYLRPDHPARSGLSLEQ